MRVAVIGAGHVGLVTCATLAAMGHEVTGNDLDPEKMALLESGKPWFYEPGLEAMVTEQVAAGRLNFTTDASVAVPGADVVFICVGTPARSNGEANLVAVEGAARDVARHASPGTVIVEKSTVPAGTSDRIKKVLERERPDIAHDLHIVSNPEFLREGRAVEDSMEPERILIGGSSDHAFVAMRELYEPILKNGGELIETDVATAELSKHACNAFLALKISYANALARICERAGADVEAVTNVMGSDSRIGHAFLNAGLGYGGYCFPKDIVAFERLAESLGYEFPLLGEVARINAEAIDSMMEKIVEALWNMEGKRVALLGLSFKPGTDDTRFSPALALAEKIVASGAEVIGYDPAAAAAAKRDMPALEIATSAYEAVRDAHCVVLCTEWPEFLGLDLVKVRGLLRYPIFIDGRNLFDPADMEKAGLAYQATGRPVTEMRGAEALAS
ncbi:MAG: UDP-glucose dehydrogenase family protein [Actinomycetota bacterium]